MKVSNIYLAAVFALLYFFTSPSLIQAVNSDALGNDEAVTPPTTFTVFDADTMKRVHTFADSTIFSSNENLRAATIIRGLREKKDDFLSLTRTEMTKQQRLELLNALGNPWSWFPEEMHEVTFTPENDVLGTEAGVVRTGTDEPFMATTDEDERNNKRLDKIRQLIDHNISNACRATAALVDPQAVVEAAIKCLSNRELPLALNSQ